MPDDLKRILVIRTDRLGDVILTLPVVLALRKAFPAASIAMLLRRYTGSIVKGHQAVDEILWYDENGKDVPFVTMLRRLRAGRFDAAVLVYPRFRLALLAALSGIPLRVGSGYRAYSFLLNRRVYEHRKSAERHELEYNLNLLVPLGVRRAETTGEAEFDIQIDPEAQRRTRTILIESGVNPDRPFVVIHPGSGGSAREWPFEKWVAVGRKIVENLQVPLVVTGNEAEGTLAHNVAGAIGKGACSLAGRLSIPDLAALLQLAQLWVGHSTGPLHLAVAMKTPVVGLYPQLLPMSPRRWGPYTKRSVVHVPDRPVDCDQCAGSDGRVCPCMASIDVDDVFRSVKSFIS